MMPKKTYKMNWMSGYGVSVSIEKEGDPVRVYLNGKLRKAWATEIGKYMINLLDEKPNAFGMDWDWYEMNRIPKVHEYVRPIEGVTKEIFYAGCSEMIDYINGKYYEMLKNVYEMENELVKQSGYIPWDGEE